MYSSTSTYSESLGIQGAPGRKHAASGSTPNQLSSRTLTSFFDGNTFEFITPNNFTPVTLSDAVPSHYFAIAGQEERTHTIGLKNYELSNHLGNVLATVADKKVYPYYGGIDCFESEYSMNTQDGYEFVNGTLLPTVIPISNLGGNAIGLDVTFGAGQNPSESGIELAVVGANSVNGWTNLEANTTYRARCYVKLAQIFGNPNPSQTLMKVEFSDAFGCASLSCSPTSSSEYILTPSTVLFDVDIQFITDGNCLSTGPCADELLLRFTSPSLASFEVLIYRVLICKESSAPTESGEAYLTSAQDYYPFGMVQPGRSFTAGDGYRYGFQGQEKDDEVKGNGNSINYKYRMHDPRLGRFFSIDPLSPKYPHYSPYSFSGNKLIAFRELEGLEEAGATRMNDYYATHLGTMSYEE